MPTTISAPGKVFLAGGYLVLDRQYTALVFGLSARIHVTIHDADHSLGGEEPQIIVRSPQFKDAEWIYYYKPSGSDGGIKVTQWPRYGDSVRVTISSNPLFRI